MIKAIIIKGQWVYKTAELVEYIKSNKHLLNPKAAAFKMLEEKLPRLETLKETKPNGYILSSSIDKVVNSIKFAKQQKQL